MSVPWFIGSRLMWGQNGFEGPIPPPLGDPNWTWDVEFAPSNNAAYATTSLAYVCGLGWFSVSSGILEYRTRNLFGADTVHYFGGNIENGLTEFIFDSNVDSVTFGWTLDASDNFAESKFNMQIWGED